MTIFRLAVALAVTLAQPFGHAQTATDGRPALAIELALPATGEYTLSLQDAAFPVAFANLTAAVLDGANILATLDASGEVSFEATNTALLLRVFAAPQAPEVVGTLSLVLTQVATQSVVLSRMEALENAQPTGPSVSEATAFSLDSAQTVSLDLTDFAVPADLAEFDVIVLDADSTPVARLTGPGTMDVDLPPGQYRLFSAATADVSEAEGNGVFRVAVTGATSGGLIDDLNVVGEDIVVQTIELDGGMVTLNASDVGFPQALEDLSAALIGTDASLVATLDQPSAMSDLPVGSYQLFVYAGAAADTGGTYSVSVDQNGTTVAESVDVTSPDVASGPRFTQVVSLDTAGTYTLGINDFLFPAALTSLSTVVVGPDGLVTTLLGEGTVSFDAAPGDYQVLVAAAAAADQEGLFGVTLEDPAGGTLLETTGGTATGGEFGEFVAAAGQRVTLTLSDLGFPAEFASLSLAVTRGNQTVGFIFGAGSFFFDVTEGGTFQYALLATPDEQAGAGLYDISVSQAASPAPEPPPEPAPEPTPPTPPSSGGGGALGWPLLLALLVHRRQKRVMHNRL